MPYRLSIRTADGVTKTYDPGELKLPCVVGRDSEFSQLVVPDGQASRAHCKLSEIDGGIAVEDLASRNGTWLGDNRINKGVLKPGDTLRVGSSQLTVSDVIEEDPDPLEGKRLGGFELIEAIGHGSYGTVYRGTQVALSRAVAVKVLSDECRRDPERVQSFLTEARRAGRLNHPHLVQVHDVCQIDEQYLLIMELMTTSAGDVLREDGPFDEAAVLRVLRDMGRALAYAESQRIVHRDVKPDNILVNEEGVYKLADLGIAMPISDDGQAHQDRIYGSPQYVAPEQARGGGIDGRADLYALGASAWHLLTGEPMYAGSSRQIVAAHLNAAIPDLRRLVAKVSPGLEDLIYKLVQKTPDKRPANAGEVAARSEQLLSTMSQPRLAAVPARRVRRRRRYRS